MTFHKIKLIISIFIAISAIIIGISSADLDLTTSTVAWGENEDGQSTPPPFTWCKGISAGFHHSLAIKTDGSIIGWGSNDWGETSPPAGNDYKLIGSGMGHGIALKNDGSLIGWGYNNNGEATPPLGNNYKSIAIGAYHGLALKNDGTIAGWGSNNYGQASPPTGNNYKAIAAGGYHSLALKNDGSIVGWGKNWQNEATPPSGNNFIAIAAGNGHSIALKSDGSLVGWGSNSHGQASPPTGNNYKAIAAGGYHSLALKNDGTIVAWGDNSSGQLKVPPGNGFISIASGPFASHSLAIRGAQIIVSKPNGGENWNQGSNQTIYWHPFGGYLGDYAKIELIKGSEVVSLINASTPMAFGGFVLTGEYHWQIPNDQAPGSDYKIRITSTSNASYTDISDEPFTISGENISSITISSPNGREVWYPGSTQTINWTYTGYPGSSVRIEALRGETVRVIIPSTYIGFGGSGSYALKLPNTTPLGDDYRIRITSNENLAYTDTSDSPFKIGQSVKFQGILHEHQMMCGGGYFVVEIKSILDDPTNLLTIGNWITIRYPSGLAPEYMPDFKIDPNMEIGDSAEVFCTTMGTTFALEDDNYVRKNNSSITVVSPNGEEIWPLGSIQTINWIYSGNPGSTVNIDVLKGTTVLKTLQGISIGSDGLGSYSLTLPPSTPIGTDYKIQVTSTSNSAFSDISDESFTIGTNIKNTFMFYSCGDNDLSKEEQKKIDMMSAAGGSTDDVTIVAMVDQKGHLNDGIYYITAGEPVKLWTPPIDPKVNQPSEIDMGNPENLIFFLNYVKSNYPAERYILVVSDHGMGMRGVFDDNSIDLSNVDHGQLEIYELGNALKASDIYIDLLYFDACDMGMVEVGYEIQDNVNVLVASEWTGWAWLTPYKNLIEWLKANPKCSAVDFGEQIVSGYIANVELEPCPEMAVIDLTKISAVATNMDALGDLLIANMPVWRSDLQIASSATLREFDYADIIDFTNKIDAQISDTQLQTATAAVRTSVDDAVLYVEHKGTWGQNSHGLSIWIYGGSGKKASEFVTNLKEYQTTRFGIVTSWNWFNVELMKPILIKVPNGDDTWYLGSDQTINWIYSDDFDDLGHTVNIEVLQGSKVLKKISEVSIGSGGIGSFTLPIPYNTPTGTDYRIRITSSSNSAYTDTSDSSFSISAGGVLNVAVPNGNELWLQGSTQTINWTYTDNNLGPTVKIEVLKGIKVINVIPEVPLGSGGTGSISLTVPYNTPPGNDYKIRITSNKYPSFNDMSDAPFTISANPPPTIISFNPISGDRGMTVRLTITGTGFCDKDNTKVALYRPGNPNQYGTIISFRNNQIICDIPIQSGLSGGDIWSVAVRNPDGQTVIKSGFQVI